MLKKILENISPILLLCLFVWPSHAQENAAVHTYQPITGKKQFYNSDIQYKSYYLLTLIQEIPELRKIIATDEVFRQLLSDKITLAGNAVKTCKANQSCYADAMKFSKAEILTVSERLRLLYQNEKVLDNIVQKHLLPSGYYGVFQQLPPQEFLVKVWEQDAAAVNYTIGVYAEGKRPNYPAIDSIAFGKKDRGFPELLSATISLNIASKKELFFEPSMNFALGALELNGRLEAADYEPMTKGINQKAIAQIKKTDFKKYKYSVILVPGAGPEERETELSATGMVRCRIAAMQYFKGAAPFVVVSGGRVHPYKTRYSEAFEMKKFMVNTLGIPENAIIAEPHARHTTTNLRNCIRLMFRYGIPMNKPGMVSTTASTIPYITGALAERCKAELGYYPYKIGKKLSDTEVEFYPSSISLQIDFDEPLDP